MSRGKPAVLAAGLGAALVLAACGSSSSSAPAPTTGAPADTGAATPTSAPPSDTAAPKPQLSGELLVWDTGILDIKSADPNATNKDGFLTQAAKAFMAENPGVTVKIVQQSGDISANAAQFRAASIAGNGPDIRIQYAGGPTQSFAKFFADLKDVLPQSVFDDLTGWNTVREGYKEDGRVLGMPYGSGLYFLVFGNNKILAKAGIDPTKTPATWEEFLANAKTVQDKTGTPGIWAANLEGYVGAWAIGALLGGQLGEQASTGMYNGDIPVNDPGMVKAYQAWIDLGDSGLTNPDAGQVSNGDSTKGFVAGKGAYYLVGSWENANMDKEFGKDVSWFYIPQLAGAPNPKAVAGGPSIAVSMTTYAKNPEAAKAFINYLAQPKVQDLYVSIGQSEGSNSKSADPSVIKNRLLREQAAALKDYSPVVFPFDSVMPQSVIDLFYRLNASTFLGKTTAQDAADQLQAQNQKEIEDR